MHEALQLIAENKVAALPVIDNHGRCVGLLSTSDLIEVARDLEAGIDELERSDQLLFGLVIEKLGDGIGHQLVGDLMSQAVISVDPEDSIQQAASSMLREHVHRLPVIDNQRHLVGIISTTDLLYAIVNETAE